MTPPAAATPEALFRFPAALRATLARIAADAGFPVGAEIVVLPQPLTPLLGRLVGAGGRWCALHPAVEWHAESTVFVPETYAGIEAVAPDLTVGSGRERSTLHHAAGIFLLELGDPWVIAAGARPRSSDGRARADSVLLLGPSRAEIQAFRSVLDAATSEPRLRFWGSSLGGLTPDPVASDDVVLPAAFKAELFGWLDRFWTLQARARKLGLPLRRGLLLVGPPGTGKTQLVRHLLTRYPDVPAHLFIPARVNPQDDPFGALLSTLRQATGPSLVVLEDIDRITASGAVTREFLLNCLDGLVDLPQPVLWIATSNDPTRLDPAILSRPGRFDRVISFPAPDREGRRALIERFSRLPIAAGALPRLIEATDGLVGAHIREACTAAMLRVLETAECYGDALLEEIERLRRQHAESPRLARSLGAGSPVGFAAGREAS